MTPLAKTILQEHEGKRLMPYVDTEGKATIGWGRNLTDVGISYDEALYLFNNDVVRAENECYTHFSWFYALDEVRREVITMLCFNLGINGLLGFKLMLKAIEAHDWSQAAWELSNSQWKTQVGKERHDCLTSALQFGEWNKVIV